MIDHLTDAGKVEERAVGGTAADCVGADGHGVLLGAEFGGDHSDLQGHRDGLVGFHVEALYLSTSFDPCFQSEGNTP